MENDIIEQENYRKRIEAIEYSVSVDDGKNTHKLKDADIIILGPSRSSKTPLCIYMANLGYKAANVPIVYNIQTPTKIIRDANKFTVGLIIDINSLEKIRLNRFKDNADIVKTQYSNTNTVKQEINTVLEICAKYDWDIIDITNQAIETTSDIILKKLNEKQRK